MDPARRNHAGRGTFDFPERSSFLAPVAAGLRGSPSGRWTPQARAASRPNNESRGCGRTEARHKLHNGGT
ncbi:hypothetical protein MRX96_016574 [Rhipicephalus microplus]